VRAHWRGIAVTVGINWLVKPFSMALLAAIFIGWLFRPVLPAGQVDSYIAGLILLAAAPCTAMVFVWSNLLDGEPHFGPRVIAGWPFGCCYTSRLSGSARALHLAFGDVPQVGNGIELYAHASARVRL
jgi:hypothetical protein